MGTMPRRDVVRKLKAAGFWYEYTRGGHEHYTNGTRKVPVPRHSKDIEDPLLSGIFREAGLK